MTTFKRILYIVYTVLAALVAAGIISACCTSCYNYSISTAVSYYRSDSCRTNFHDNTIYHAVDSANLRVDSIY